MSHLYDPEHERRKRQRRPHERPSTGEPGHPDLPRPSTWDEVDRTVVQTRHMRLGASAHRSWGPSHPTPGAAGLLVELGALLFGAIGFVVGLPFRRSNMRLRRTRGEPRSDGTPDGERRGE